ncbi:two-component regulator propeller domain-containing protein [Zobellia uliginosa]|uniref:two-component regulator propeller domain-containing protein n=1 Tax=Zobellia uliginosa TaxID=143224 RepID=UPI0026E19F25|nr:two-component regulator propeller domain-containing protein [Zobellia uliginosa]MDO6519347.1 two-component regulator propeller domain-containing protein [Zobellia uliginosa]
MSTIASCLAQGFDYKISVLNNELSITDNVASSFYKDKKGFLWIGKMDGLYQYNGYDYEVFPNTFNGKTGLSNPWVTTLNGLHDYLVVGTKNGLNLFNKTNRSFAYIFPSESNPKRSSYITSVDIGFNKKGMYVGTTNGLFWVLLDPSGSYVIQEIDFKGYSTTADDHPEVHQIIAISEGAILRTSKGLFFLRINSHVAEPMYVGLDKGEGFLENLETLHLTNSGELLIFSGGDTYFSDLKVSAEDDRLSIKAQAIYGKYKNWPNPVQINNFLEDIKGNIWIGTEGEGLFVYNKQNANWRNYRHKINRANVLKNDYIRTLYEDPSGMIVVGTDAGVNTVITLDGRFRTINKIDKEGQAGADIVNVHGILEDADHNLWLGTRGKGLFVLNSEDQIQVDSDTNGALGHVRSIIQDRNGAIWIGTQGGIFIVDKFVGGDQDLKAHFYHKKASLLPGKRVYSILEDKDGNKWISTASGLYVYNVAGKLRQITNTSIGTSLDNKIIYSLLLDSKGSIWFGTLNGRVAYLEYKDYSIQISKYGNLGKPLNFKIIRIDKAYKKYFENYESYNLCEVADNKIMVGTNFGICEIDFLKKEIKPFFPLNSSSDVLNLGRGYVYGLLYDKAKNTLWASSNNGIFTYNFDTSELERYGVKDGLQSLEFNGNSVYAGKSGNFYFGGANGLNSYDSSIDISKNDYRPNLVLTRLIVNGKPIKVNDGSEILSEEISYAKGIRLRAKQNTVGLEFAALHLPYSSNNTYKCKLIGVDNDWRFLGNERSINYANLPQGDYRFHLLGTNNDGVWNTEELVFEIQVLPAWYATWWMKLFWYLLAAGIVMAFVFVLVKNRDSRNEVKIQEIERKKLSEIYESKLIFFTNISHELRTPLSLISDPIQSLIQQKRAGQDSELLGIVRTNVERLRRLVDQIMDFRKYEYGKLELDISEGDIVESVRIISHSFLHVSKIKNVKYKVKLPKEPLLMFYDHDKVEKILYNLLSNAFKAVQHGGQVKVSIGALSTKKKRFGGKKYKLICGEKDYPDPDNHIFLKVDDNGVGISEEHVRDVFDRFYQDDTINSGTGIGLYMVKQLSEMHFGSVLLKSKKNKGASFVVLLPKNKDLYKVSNKVLPSIVPPTSGADIFQAPVQEEALAVGELKDYSVAIVEDNDELRMYLKRVLQNNFNVYTAINGVEGVDLIREITPDVVVSDILMPEMNGLDLCKKIKGDFETSHIPIIMLTARAFDQQIVEGINSGADAYLTKPFNKDILIAKINNLIKSREKLRLMFQNAKILEPSEVTVTSIDEKLLWKLKQTIEDNIQDQNLTLEKLATEVGVSRAQLFRKVKALTGLTPNNFIKSIRLKYAVLLLEEGKFQISEIAFLSGFKEASYFSRCFKEAYGCSPKEYKKGK